jgi:membrane-associated phospholipid phosphatase
MSALFSMQRSPIRDFLLIASLLIFPLVTPAAHATDPVLDWIEITNDSLLAAGATPLVSTRNVALVSASIFDSVNGITHNYRPFYVRLDAPHRASANAAAIESAYAMLIKIYPAQTASLTTQRDASIAAVMRKESQKSIQEGMAWGQTVADAIWAYRLNDGIAPNPPPFVGVLGIEGTAPAIGVWRPTPLVNAFGAGPQFASMTPWVLKRPSQFRPPPPNALTSAEYAVDYNEIKTMGVYDGSGRSSDESELVLFWAGNTPVVWNRIASQIAAKRSLSLSENSHLFALLDISMADAAIACWDAKYRYVFWRPITAIRAGDVDGNAATDPDSTWTPWLDFFPAGTPAHPEYPSGHSTVSGAAAAILSGIFGDDTAFTVISDVRPGTRSFPSFSAAVEEIANARVFGGIHFRVSCVRGNALGQAVAAYVVTHALREQ